jgi:tight adherence protein C
MLILIVALAGLAVFSLATFLIQLAPAQPDTIRRLEEMGAAEDPLHDAFRRRHRQERSERLREILEEIGGRMMTREDKLTGLRRRLVQAGYTSPTAAPLFLGTRLALAMGLASGVLFLVPLLGLSPLLGLLGGLWGFAVGWLFPGVVVSGRTKRRQKEIIKALPDALDLLVVCVEAGLGLNQAMVRVAQEIGHVSPVLGEQLELTNLEIRAGTPRDEALRNLGERTGVEDVQSFVGMLIQTDRFGTSIADALRVHSDVLRTKRRQRAEEAAAKTAIKMLFPLVFFIFPAMFVVILGPAVIQVIRGLSGV